MILTNFDLPLCEIPAGVSFYHVLPDTPKKLTVLNNKFVLYCIVLYCICNLSFVLVCSIAVYIYDWVVPYFNVFVERVEIKRTSKTIQRYYKWKSLITDWLSNCCSQYISQWKTEQWTVLHARSDLSNWFSTVQITNYTLSLHILHTARNEYGIRYALYVNDIRCSWIIMHCILCEHCSFDSLIQTIAL